MRENYGRSWMQISRFGSRKKNYTFENATGFGLKLISLMTRQIKGYIKIERKNGTKIILEFEV